MATYKQRTPLARHTHIDEEDSHDTFQQHQQHQHHVSYPHNSHTSITLSNTVDAPGHQQQLSSASYNQGLSYPPFPNQSNNNNDIFLSTTASLDNTTSPTSDQDWAAIGEPSFSSYSSSQRKSRQQQQQQLEHQGQQQQRAHEWHFVLNQPSRRRQLQLQQQQLQQQQEESRERAPLLIIINGGGAGGGGVAGDTVAASRDYISFFSAEENVEEEEEKADFSASSIIYGEEDGEPTASLSSSPREGLIRRQRSILSTAVERRMRLRDEAEKEAAATITAPNGLAVPPLFLSDDTAGSLDFAFSDLTSEHEQDHRSLWSNGDDHSESYYSSPSPYNVAGYPPFGHGYGYNHSSSSFNKKATSTMSTASPSATSYTSTPLLQTRRFPPSPSGTSLVVSTTTPYSSSNSLSQLLFSPTLPPQQQPQQLQQQSQQQFSSFGRDWSRFQTHYTHDQSQMPIHDGSGNFVLSSSSSLLSSTSTTGTTRTGTLSAGVSESGSDLEPDLYPRLRQHQHPIWDLKPPVFQQQQQKQQDASVSSGGGATRSRKMMMMTMKERKMLNMKRLHNSSSSSSSSKSSARVRSISPPPSGSTMALHGGERAKSRLRERISVYDSEEEEDMKAMEEMNALVIDIPATMGWLQVIEQALSTFRSSFEVELQDSSDSDITHPIKAWANWNEDYGDTTYNKDPVKYSTSAATTRTKATPKGHPSLMPLSQSASSVDSPKLRHEREMIQVKHQMSASSLLTLQRLQSQHHHTQQLYQHQTQRRYSFLCTQGYHHHRQDALEEESSDSSSGSSSSSTTLLEAAILALCRFRDHVKSNLMDPALDEELESGLSRLGFGGDFGMVVAD